jgi:hypothetical protein
MPVENYWRWAQLASGSLWKGGACVDRGDLSCKTAKVWLAVEILDVPRGTI